MFRLENRAQTLIFILPHFDQKSVKMTILIKHFLHLVHLKIITGACFVLTAYNWQKLKSILLT